jgi:hypothetical protein
MKDDMNANMPGMQRFARAIFNVHKLWGTYDRKWKTDGLL